jgi:hypothetical protein
MNFLEFGVGVGEKGLATEAQSHRERRARRTMKQDPSLRSRRRGVALRGGAEGKIEEKTDGKDGRLKKRAQQEAPPPIQKQF